MLEVEYKGGNTIILRTKQGVLVTDPKTSVVGLKDTVVKDAIEVATEERFALTDDGAKLHVEGPGEYGVSGFDIRGVAAQRHLDSGDQPKAGAVYRVEAAGFRIAILGNIYEKLSESQLEGLGVVDLLVIPVGGNGYTLDATGAAHLTRQIDPRAVIPVHYAESGVNYEVPQGELDPFVKELSVEVEETAKYKLKSPSQLPAGLTVVKLARS